ncbi:MAG: hypothetical protein J2P17_29000 [Mycobacterium sp.]|nr:hypothetical protein [Mycobacterium sp.]
MATGALVGVLGGGAVGIAGVAGAATPIVDPGQGRLGVRLDNAETRALGDGPLPALVAKVVPARSIGAGLQRDTQLWRDPRGGVHASLRQVIAEAGDRGGTVSLMLNAPGTRGPRALDIFQHWN